ncbi:hypothetical protein HDV03_000391 [Kappamyces sp. JEL0829]|nr:hypothetical protein HDV03_000391 [Kappamyces sp. JEL0829]
MSAPAPVTTAEEYIERGWGPEKLFGSRTKVTLFAKTWTPTGEVKATVIFCHGYGEHIQRYEEFFTYLATEGIKVGSFGAQGVTGGIPAVLEDIKLVSDKIRIEGVPHFIMGQSMGGFLALYYSSLHPEEFAGAIACSPLITAKIAPTAVEKFALGRLPNVFPGMRFPVALDPALLSHDTEEVAKYGKDPLVHNQGDLRLLSFLSLKIQPMMMSHAPNYKLPLLIVHGSEDNITDPTTSKAFFDACASADKSYHLVEGAFHEVHNELPKWKEPIFAHYVNWIKTHLREL